MLKVFFLFLMGCAAFKEAQARIVFPDTQVGTTSQTSAVWLVTTVTTNGTEVKLAAVEYSWRPTSGLITVNRVADGADIIFKNGFDGGVPLPNGGIMDATWWLPRTGPGPAGWETNRWFVSLQTGRYKINVYYFNGAAAVNFTEATFTVLVP